MRGGKGWKNCQDWTDIKAEEVGLGRKRLVRSRGWRGGVGLGCFSFEVRGGGVEAGSSKV